MPKKYIKTGTSLISNAIIVGAIPNVGNNATVETMKTNVATGYGNMGKVFPAMGTMAGAGMIMKASRKLFKHKTK